MIAYFLFILIFPIKGDYLQFDSVITYDDLCYIEIKVGLYNTDNSLQSISGIPVYFSFDPPYTLLYNGWIQYSTNGLIVGTLYQCCSATFLMIAEAIGYDPATKSLTISQTVFTVCEYTDINVNGNYFCIDEIIKVTVETDCTYGIVVSDTSLNILDVYGSVINGESNTLVSNWPITIDIYFSAVGTKKILGVIGNFYAKYAAQTIEIETSYLTITLPYGPVIIIQPSYVFEYFSLNATIFDCHSILCSTCNDIITIDSSPTGLLYSINTLAATNGVSQFINLAFISSENLTIKASASTFYDGIFTSIVLSKVYLKVTLLSIPDNSLDIFSVKVQVYDSEFSRILENCPFSIVIFLNPTGNLSGSTTGSIINGEVIMSGLAILDEGTFQINADCSECIIGTSIFVTIDNYYLKVTLNPNSGQFSTENKFTITVDVFDDSSMNYPYLSGLFTFTINLESYYPPISDITTNGKYISPPISIPITGTYSISASSPKVYPGNILSIIIADYYLKIDFPNNNILSIIIADYYLKIDFPNNIPKNYQSIFTIIVSIHDSINTENLYENKNFIINIELIPIGELNGILTKTTVNGIAEFSYLNITTDDTYVISAYGIGVISRKSIEFKVGTYYIETKFKGKIPLTTESIFDVEILIYREEELITICTYKDFEVELKLSPEGLLIGNINEYSSSGFVKFKILSIGEEGIYKIYGKANDTFSIYSDEFVIKNFYINIVFYPEIPFSTESIFSIEIKVYNETDMVNFCYECFFILELSIDNQGLLEGITKSETTSGIGYFNNLYIKSENYYFLKVSGYEIISSFSSKIIIKDFYLKIDLNPIVKPKQPKHTLNEFEAIVSIFSDNNYLNLYTNRSYSIILSIYSLINTFETHNKNSNSGIAVFKKLIISESNTYNIIADGIGVNPNNYSNIFIDKGTFSWQGSVDEQNNLIIKFEKSLNATLEKPDFHTEISSSIKTDFTIKQLSDSMYELKIIASETIQNNTKITLIVLKSNLKSTDDYIFDYSELVLSLFYSYKSFESFKQLAELMNSSKPLCQAAASSVVASSVISNPSILWSIMSCMDAMAYLPISEIEYSDNLIGFFSSFGSLQVFPNPFEYIFTVSNSTKPYDRALKYGFTSSFMFYNAGILLANFIVSISLIPVFLIGKKVLKNNLGEWCKKMLESYKYAYFIRFFVQSYLDLGLLALIQIKSKLVDTPGGWVNIVFSWIMLMIFIGLPFTIFIFSLVCYRKNKFVDNEEFMKKWGSLYEEFKNDKGFFSTQYYTVFTMRRLVYVIMTVYLNDNLPLQYSIHLILSLLQILFIFYYFPFKEKEIFIITAIGEISTLLIICFSFAFIADSSLETRKNVEVVIVFVVVICLGANIGVSLNTIFINTKGMFNKIKNIYHRNKVHPNTENSQNNIKNPREITYLYSFADSARNFELSPREDDENAIK
ncbi:hypothetical protein SteCoe_24215 [Stentor coeruleus]|uniref:TRP C-terminal domain-containing protein n=1 Tax=Stentor coeruleus TaxID=5963 RepID=A0A1R2BI37_9CILI|nr:hypothetical protein SteCoe_24215 [Stentor coeruleus]